MSAPSPEAKELSDHIFQLMTSGYHEWLESGTHPHRDFTAIIDTALTAARVQVYDDCEQAARTAAAEYATHLKRAIVNEFYDDAARMSNKKNMAVSIANDIADLRDKDAAGTKGD